MPDYCSLQTFLLQLPSSKSEGIIFFWFIRSLGQFTQIIICLSQVMLRPVKNINYDLS